VNLKNTKATKEYYLNELKKRHQTPMQPQPVSKQNTNFPNFEQMLS